VLTEKKKKLREELLNYLDSKNANKLHVAPYKMWYMSIPRYEYDVRAIYERLHPQDLFLDIVNIKTSNYVAMLSDKALDDELVDNLLNARKVISVSRCFYVKRTI
jgi:hypothetical protein